MPRSLRLTAALSLLAVAAGPATGPAPFRPPAVPLVLADPYLSVWSAADRLTDSATRHWTGRPHPLTSIVRVDGHPFRLMGADPTAVPPMPQVGPAVVTPTKTVYAFQWAGVGVTLTFLTPLLPHDLDLMGRPVTYLTWDVRSTDGAAHAVQLLDATSGLLAVNDPAQPVTWGREAAGELTLLKIGTQHQPVLAASGDDQRIDWGYAYTAARSGESTAAIGGTKAVLATFAESGKLPAADDARQPRPASDDAPVCAVAFDLGQVGPEPVTRQAMVGYDEVRSIKYFGTPLKPYWRRNGDGPAELFNKAAADYAKLAPRCEAFDRELTADAIKVGGDHYADIVALAYRQAVAGSGLAADAHGQPLLFTKENSSNGDIATVDVIIPMSPVWLLLSPNLAKAAVVPVLDYAASPNWKFPNAPHDLGTYPVVRGTDDGGEAMPVEESGNMLILCDAISRQANSAAWADKWWPTLTAWAKYLEQYGLDPEDQLCTDDFMGHLAHNSNLSVKAILALAAYGDMARLRGDTATADRYRALAVADAKHWAGAADDGDHFRLAFDRPGTWSQKYNLVWDRVLGLDVFPPEVAAKEVAFYRTRMKPYGLPLDSRTTTTESTWSLWSATLATEQKDFRAIVDPLALYLTTTSARTPFADSYDSTDPRSSGMHARPVIGSVFMKLLADRDTWAKWSAGDQQKVGDWAPLPRRPTVTEVVPTARTAKALWQYTTVAPKGDGWTRPDFKADGWKTGPGAFGTVGPVGTAWTSPDIWVRRTVTLPADLDAITTQVVCWHDEDVQVYVDGVFAAGEAGFINSYDVLPIDAAARAKLRPGATVTIAAHCHQTSGGQILDVGLAKVTMPAE